MVLRLVWVSFGMFVFGDCFGLLRGDVLGLVRFRGFRF